MRIQADDARSREMYRVVDKESGQLIHKVRWADTDSGELGIIRCVERGVPVDNLVNPEEVVVDTIKCHFCIVRADDLSAVVAESE